MKKIILFGFLMIGPLVLLGQGISRQYADLEGFLIKETLDTSIHIIGIEELELVNSDEIEKPLVDKLRGFLHFDHLIDNYEYFKDQFKTIDLNDDGKLDIFYSGFLGGASDSYSFIFLNSDDGFIKAFSGDMGVFLFAGRKGNSLNGLIYCYEGPAAACPELCNIDYIGFNDLDAKVENIVRFPNDAEIPQRYLETYVAFTVKNEKYYLRSIPEISDTDSDCGLVGNIHSTYTTGDNGIAYASESDDTGRIWYFVIMKNRIAGWMSSRYLEEQ